METLIDFAGGIIDREAFRGFMESAVFLSWKEAEDADRSVNASKAFKKAVLAAVALNEALAELNEAEVARIGNHFEEVKRFGSLEQLASLVNEQSGFSGLRHAILVLTSIVMSGTGGGRWNRDGRRRGRKPGTLGNFSFHRLVGLVDYAARRSGGKFTFSPNRGSGTLLDAVRLLRDNDYLPPKVVPSAGLPISTIKRILKRAKRFPL
jgi:hypothetical protein